MTQRALQEASVRYFLEVVRTGSINEAASKLNVAPSAISRQIAKLEHELGTLLFDRRSRGLYPNAAGDLLAAFAKRSEQDIERVCFDIQTLRGLRQSRVRLASVEGIGHDFLPALAADFRVLHPTANFDIDLCSHREVTDRIRNNRSDIGITLSKLPERDIEVELRHPNPIMAIMAPSHPLSGQSKVSLSQVIAFPLAMPVRGSSVRDLIDTALSRQGLEYSVAANSNRIDTLVSFVSATPDVITFYSELSVRRMIDAGDIRAVLLKEREMNERHIEIQTLAKRNLSNPARAFLLYLNHAITRTPYL